MKIKTRKLFAILVITMMLLAMVPMTAFAAQGNRFASTFSIDVTSVVADNTAAAQVTVYIADGAGVPQAGESVIIASNRGIVDSITWDAAYGAAAYPVTDANGKVVVNVKSLVQGPAKIAAAVAYNPYGAPAFANIATHAAAVIDYLNGSTAFTANALMIINTADITFTSASAGNVVLIADPTPADVANGLIQKTIVATVRSGSVVGAGSPVANSEVTFSSNKPGLTFDKATYTTDAFGRATAKISSTKAGVYAVTASSGGKTSAAVNYTFIADATPYNLEFAKEATETIATGAASVNLIKVKVTDLNGNRITAAGAVTPSVPTKPTGSTATLALNATANDASGNYQYDLTVDKAGSYVLRFALANGKFVETTVVAAVQGAVTGLSISYTEKSLTIPAAGANVTAAASVKQLDANGVAKTAAGTLVFSISNPAVATIGATGIVTTTTLDAKNAQVLTITVVDTTNNLTATTTLPLVGSAVTMNVNTPDAVEVNAKATVNAKFVDVNGSTVALLAAPATMTWTVLSKPAGAGLDIAFSPTAGDDFNKKGEASLTVSSTVAGDVSLLVRVQQAVTNTWFVTPVTVTFKAPKAPKVVKGAASVTMFIGSKSYVQDGAGKGSDAAAFIQDGRTFVPVRVIAEAFDAVADWTPKDGAVEVVTLTRSDVQIIINIGSYVIEVVRDGVTSTVTSDVAAFIKDGRTFLPFRVLAEVFGAEVDYGPKDAAIEWVSFKQ